LASEPFLPAVVVFRENNVSIAYKHDVLHAGSLLLAICSREGPQFFPGGWLPCRSDKLLYSNPSYIFAPDRRRAPIRLFFTRNGQVIFLLLPLHFQEIRLPLFPGRLFFVLTTPIRPLSISLRWLFYTVDGNTAAFQRS